MKHPGAVRTTIVLGCALIVGVTCSASAPPSPAGDTCAITSGPARLADLPEASGLALSLRTPGVLWSHNDSGQPVLAAVDAKGTARGRVRIANATVEDWEDVSAARCASGNCLYVADIGDNNRSRAYVTIYRLPEPAPQATEPAMAEVLTATYPDGPHDAEALFVLGGDLYVVTKDDSSTIYRLPNPAAGKKTAMERVATLPLKRVTDAETSADGAWVAIRTGHDVAFYRASDIRRGGPAAITVSLSHVKEPQGEGVALDANGTLYLTSEGNRAGSLVVLRCALPK